MGPVLLFGIVVLLVILFVVKYDSIFPEETLKPLPKKKTLKKRKKK